MYINRANKDSRSVIIRQYCRVIAKFINRKEAEMLVDRIIQIVKSNPAENIDNDETYFNYYGGKNAACQAFINHLSVPHPKYDAKLHLYLLEHLASEEYVKKIIDVTNLWDTRENYIDAIAQAVEGIKYRTSK